MEPTYRRFFREYGRGIRVYGIASGVCYIVGVGAFALWKASSAPQFDRLSWAEVFHGPAITVLSCFLLLMGTLWIEHPIRSDKGA